MAFNLAGRSHGPVRFVGTPVDSSAASALIASRVSSVIHVPGKFNGWLAERLESTITRDVGAIGAKTVPASLSLPTPLMEFEDHSSMEGIQMRDYLRH